MNSWLFILLLILTGCASQPAELSDPWIYGIENPAPKAVRLGSNEIQAKQIVNKLRMVHRNVKRNFRYQKEEVEHWGLQDGYRRFTGDCDDYAIAVRRKLTELGIPSRYLATHSKENGYHLSVVAYQYVIDFRASRVKTRKAYKKEFRERYVIISGYNPGDPWHKVK